MSDTADHARIEVARERFEMLQSRLNAAKIAYLNSTELDGHQVTYEHLRRVAEEMIEAHYELQRLRYGKVRLRLSVPKVLRRGR